MDQSLRGAVKLSKIFNPKCENANMGVRYMEACVGFMDFDCLLHQNSLFVIKNQRVSLALNS